MPTTTSGLPFQGSIQQSAHASYQGAQAAKERALPQVLVYLRLLNDRFPDGLTDSEAADLMTVERSTINARRGSCVQAGLVEAHGFRDGKAGTVNTVWRISRA